MCPNCEDFARTVLLLGHLALYSDRPDADADFAELVGGSLAASLPNLTAGHNGGDDPADGEGA